MYDQKNTECLTIGMFEKLKMKKVLIHKIIWIFTRKNFNSVSFYLRIRIAISAEGQRQSKWKFPSSSLGKVSLEQLSAPPPKGGQALS